MGFDFNRRSRRSIRMKGYDYSKPGNYFITICTMNQECLLGEILAGKMILSAAGEIANSEWLRTSNVRPEIELDAFVIMPNHLHGIIIKHARRGDPLGRTGDIAIKDRASNPPPGTDKLDPLKPTDSLCCRDAPTLEPGTIGSIVGQFKSMSTKKIRETDYLGFHWQRNYYEHIICDRSELENIRKYILENPFNWQDDQENPKNLIAP
jgi:putative transposase